MKDQIMIEIPNAHQWIGVREVARLLCVTERQVRRMSGTLFRVHAMDGVTVPVYWRPEIEAIAAARIRAGMQGADA